MLLSNPAESDQSSIFSHERSHWPANESILVGSFAMGSQNRPDNLKNNEIEHQSQKVMVRAAHGSGMQYPYGKEKGSISMAVNALEANHQGAHQRHRALDKR